MFAFGSLRSLRVMVTSFFLLLASAFCAAQGSRSAVAAHMIDTAQTNAVDTGATPVSQPMQLTLRLAPSANREAALEQLLAAQVDSSSKAYHRWLTPGEFAASYGATDDQITTVTEWAQSQGLTVIAVSPAKTRLTVTGTVAQVQGAFAISLRNYAIAGGSYYGPASRATMPNEVASLVAGVWGLSNVPSAANFSVVATGRTNIAAGASARMIASSAQPEDTLTATASVIDDNSTPILAFSTTACSSDLTQADYDNYRALFHQASAQGITIVATSSCGTRGTGSFPGSLSEVSSITTEPTTEAFVGIDPRPSWQAAPGLPEDGVRNEPDLTTSSLGDFTNALTSIEQQSGGRQGNINAVLYELATTPGLYTQPDEAVAGTWESATGLGRIDLNTLIKVYPRGTNGTTTTLTASSGGNSVVYGTPVTLTATVTGSGATTGPTGTVTFSTTSQGTIGQASLSGNTASITVGNLNVGTYLITATYSGDANYSTSSGTASVTVTIATATISATISPTQNVPYGSTATVTATVALPNSGAAPSGTISAQIEGITGAVYTGTLSPNPGGNTATANISINVPPPQTGGYTVQVTCAGNTNFQCQTPANLTFTTAKGNTSTTVSLTPAAPQAGQPVTITAAINNNGNGTGTYTFSGSIVFTDTTTGKTMATVPVGTNQATTSQVLTGNVQHNIVATYTGDANWNGSASNPSSVQPTMLPSTLSLVANTSNTLAGVQITFTATVYTTASNSVGPTGTVTFYDTFNAAVAQLGVPTTLVSNGPNQSIAIFSTTGLQAGTHSVYAIYNGDSNFSSATSSTYALTITDFNLNFVPQTLTIKAGQTGQAVVLLGVVGGFSGTVSFGCTPPSNAEATCSFTQVSLSGGGSTTLKIATTAATMTSSRAILLRWSGLAGPVFAVLLWFGIPRRRRGLPGLLAVVAAVCLMANILGCGTGKQTTTDTGSSDSGTPLGSQIYTITAAGSDGVNTTRHTYQYQVTIQ